MGLPGVMIRINRVDVVLMQVLAKLCYAVMLESWLSLEKEQLNCPKSPIIQNAILKVQELNEVHSVYLEIKSKLKTNIW